MRKIVLLDLNSTLAVKTGLNTFNWTYDISKDEYSQELVAELLAGGYEIHLVTARPEKYKKDTLNKIELDTDLVIHRAVFKPNDLTYVPVHDFKREYLRSLLEDEGVPLENIIAVESNSNTHKTYKSLGLTAVWTRDKFLKLKKSENGGVLF